MLNLVLRQLIEKKLTTVREIVELTGRGETTVYRWVNGKTQPDFDDMRRLLRHLPDHTARQAILSFFTSDLPVEIEWLSDDIDLVPGVGDKEKHHAFDLSLLALECMVDILGHVRHDTRNEALSSEANTEALAHIEAVMRYMTLARRALVEQGEQRKKAKTDSDDH